MDIYDDPNNIQKRFEGKISGSRGAGYAEILPNKNIMKNRLEIEKMVKKIRKGFEQKEISREKLVQLYSDYNPKLDPNIFVLEAEKIFPKLNCGLTTVYLRDKLGGKIIKGTYNGVKHTFLLLDKNLIVDITADQYGGPEIYVGEMKPPWSVK